MKNYEYRDLRPPQYHVEYNLLLLMIELAPLLAAEAGDRRPPLSNVLKENELDGNLVIKQYLTTASDGKDYNVAQNMIDNVK